MRKGHREFGRVEGACYGLIEHRRRYNFSLCSIAGPPVFYLYLQADFYLEENTPVGPGGRR
jgi:hypothetical protein